MLIFMILLLLGLVLRCYYTDWNKKLTGDEVGYNKMVLQLLHDGVYGYTPYDYSKEPNAFTTPGYPLFLAGCYVIFGHDGDKPPIVQIQALQILIQILSAVIFYAIARRLFEHRGISLLMMSCILFHPSFILSPLFLLTETLYGFFFLLFIYLLVRVMQGSSMPWFLGLGLVFGICILIRPAIIPFIAVLLAGVFIFGRKQRVVPVWKSLSAIIIGFVLIMMPWWVRNMVTLDRILLLAEQGGSPLLWGSFPFTRFPNVESGLDAAEMGRMAYQRIIDGFSHDFFVYFSWYTWGKMMFFIREIFPGLSYLTSNAMVSSTITSLHIILVCMGLLGLLKMFIHERKNGAYMMVAMLALVSILLYLPFSPTPRYFYPVLPLCFLGFGYLVLCISRSKKSL